MGSGGLQSFSYTLTHPSCGTHDLTKLGWLAHARDAVEAIGDHHIVVARHKDEGHAPGLQRVGDAELQTLAQVQIHHRTGQRSLGNQCQGPIFIANGSQHLGLGLAKGSFGICGEVEVVLDHKNPASAEICLSGHIQGPSLDRRVERYRVGFQNAVAPTKRERQLASETFVLELQASTPSQFIGNALLDQDRTKTTA